MAPNKRKLIRDVYDTAYALVYWGRRNMERFEAGDPETKQQIAEYMRMASEADQKAVKAGIPDAQLEHIHGHAAINALLKISSDGSYHYKAYYVSVERDPSGESRSYLIVSQEGDAPEPLQKGKAYAWFEFTEEEALVHCYYKTPIQHQEARLIVLFLIAQKQLGNYGIVNGKSLGQEGDEE